MMNDRITYVSIRIIGVCRLEYMNISRSTRHTQMWQHEHVRRCGRIMKEYAFAYDGVASSPLDRTR